MCTQEQNQAYLFPSLCSVIALNQSLEITHGDFPGGPVAKAPCSQCRSPNSILGQGTRSPMPQVSVCMPQRKDPTCHNEHQRSHVMQLKPGEAK